MLPLTTGAMVPTVSLASSPAFMFASEHAPSLCIVWSVLIILLTHAGPPDELLFALNGLLCAWVQLSQGLSNG